MAIYSDDELRYARPIAEAVLAGAGFRRWLLAGTWAAKDADRFRPVGPRQGALMDPPMRTLYWFNVWCARERGCSCRIGETIETDILQVLEAPDGTGLALHFEVKPPGNPLHPGQAETYPRRAACWADPGTRPASVWPHRAFLTFLVCGRELSADSTITFFDKVLYHDEIAAQIQPYPEPV